MKVLTLTQPWATLVICGAKQIETRSWKTPHRGELGIHAAKGFPRWAKDLCFEEPFCSALAVAGVEHPDDLPRGYLLGTVTLVDCLRTAAPLGEGARRLWPDEDNPLGGIGEVERAFGDYSPGRFAWLLADPTPLAVPEKMSGALGLWECGPRMAA